MKTYNQASFVAALKQGVHDFSECQFEGPIDINHDTGIDWSVVPGLIFDRSNLGSDFSFGRWNQAPSSLSMEGVTSRGRVALTHLQLCQVNVSHSTIERWLAVMHCNLQILNLAGAKVGGFITKGTRGKRLDLTSCVSAQSLFDETSFSSIEDEGAILGRRTPTSLGELAQ